MDIDEYVVVQFYPWFKFYFRLSWLFLMYDNEFETKENKIWTKDKIEPQVCPSIFTHKLDFHSCFLF